MILSTEKINEFKSLISRSKNIVLFVHHNPDGDALGSSLALKSLLDVLDKNCTVISPNELPNTLSFLPAFDSIIVYESNTDAAKKVIKSADLYICCDFNAPSRLLDMHKSINFSAVPTICIDHHPFPDGFAQLFFSETSVSSTSELLFHILMSCGYIPQLSLDGADSIFTGIVTDTGGFSHNCSRPALYMAIAKLMEMGVRRDLIYDRIFRSNTIERLKLTGNCLGDKLVHLDDFATAYFTITSQDKDIYKIKPGDTEGLVNMPLSVKGIVLSAMFTEGEGMVKVSLRSKFDFPANALCQKYFNGGGHTNAAGGRINATLAEAILIFQNSLIEFQSELIRFKEYASNN